MSATRRCDSLNADSEIASINAAVQKNAPQKPAASMSMAAR